jgi:hypothetical protein
MPGLVRLSFGLYNSFNDIDMLGEALRAIAAGRYKGTYIQDRTSGEYIPIGWNPNFDNFFSFRGAREGKEEMISK